MSFDPKFFTENRKRLSEVLPNHLVFIPAHSLMQMSADQAFPFRQDSSFWYFCGINEPDLILIIDTISGESTVLLPEQNDYHDEWDGVHDVKEFESISGIKQFVSAHSLEHMLQSAHSEGRKVGYLEPYPDRVEPYGFYANPARAKLAEKIKMIDSEPVDVRIAIAKLRQIKQPQEIIAIQTAIDLTASALKEIQDSWHNIEKNEKELEKILSKRFIEADGHAYEPIVASGKNAATIHYMKNNSKIQNNEFVLLDVGARVGGYAADISRTWFVGDKISERQKQLYELVQKTQKFALSLLKPGVFLKEYQLEVENYSKKLLNELNIDLEHYPHGISHFLGLDVHDAGDYSLPLKENMVLTVEPGVYLPEEGIGIRIEDDVRITSSGIEVMSKQIPSDLLYLQ